MDEPSLEDLEAANDFLDRHAANAPGHVCALCPGPCIVCGAYDGDHDEGCTVADTAAAPAPPPPH